MDDKELRLACVQQAIRTPGMNPDQVVPKAREIYEFCVQSPSPSIIPNMEDESCSTQRPQPLGP